MTKEIQCPNCKKSYRFKRESKDKTYKYLYVHDEPCCPYGLEAYHHSREKCRNSVREHILSKFKWIKREDLYKKKNRSIP